MEYTGWTLASYDHKTRNAKKAKELPKDSPKKSGSPKKKSPSPKVKSPKKKSPSPKKKSPSPKVKSPKKKSPSPKKKKHTKDKKLIFQMRHKAYSRNQNAR